MSNHSNKDSSSINSEDSNTANNNNNLTNNDSRPSQTSTLLMHDMHHSTQIGSPTSQLGTSKISAISANLFDNAAAAPLQLNPASTARSISSVTTGSLSFDLLDQLKPSNGNHNIGASSDVDSEGYSIRPADAVSLDLRSQSAFGVASSSTRRRRNKDNDDMNNFYHNSSSTTNSGASNNNSDSSSDSDSDDDGGDSVGPVKVMLKIKPKSEIVDDAEKQKNNTDVLREISKNLQLKPPGQALTYNSNTIGRNSKQRAYYYNYGTSAAAASTTSSSTASTSTIVGVSSTSTTPTPTPTNEHPMMSRSISAGSVMAPGGSIGGLTISHSLLDLDFSTKPAATTSSTSLVKTGAGEMSVTSNLYNIDEDKEVESSFNPASSGGYQTVPRKSSTSALANSGGGVGGGAQSPGSTQAPTPVPPPTTAANNGRFTPACFPGRTTPDFRHTTSLFEQQGTRASIVSPLTINGGSEIIPIAIAFNETIHAYFKMADPTKFKVSLHYRFLYNIHNKMNNK